MKSIEIASGFKLKPNKKSNQLKTKLNQSKLLQVVNRNPMKPNETK